MADSLLKIGMEAPDFELPSTLGEKISLRGILGSGPVIIVFYVSDWGMMCNVVMRAFKEMYEEFRKYNARILAISTNSIFSHRAWAEHMKFPFPLLSDFDGKVSKKYGVLYGQEGYLKGYSNRAVFVLDSNGVIRYIWIADDPSFEPNYEEIRAEVKKAHGK
ncbi:MAG: peroxiredoxin [Methanomassiliicoccales archaeon]|jgi:peroxiredoxin|nr:peroxiredoxin [Methanomassiliicoccales archaeon]